MKSKVSERDKSKREMYHGELKRREIRDIVLSAGTNGVTVSEIKTQLARKRINISLQQVHSYLKEECAKNRFDKKRTRYCVKPLITPDDWSILSTYINDLQYLPNFNDIWMGKRSTSS